MPARLSIFRGRVQTVMQFSQLSGGGGKPGTVTPSPEGRYSVCVCVCVLGRGWGVGWGGRNTMSLAFDSTQGSGSRNNFIAPFDFPCG